MLHPVVNCKICKLYNWCRSCSLFYIFSCFYRSTETCF